MAEGDKRSLHGEGDEEHPPEGEHIHEQARALTAKWLRGEHVDPRGVEDVVRTMAGGAEKPAEAASPQARQALLDALQSLDEQLMRSAQAAHVALQRVAARGMDFTDNDLKEVHATLSGLQGAYVETVKRVSGAASGSLQHEIRRLATHSQEVGVDASVKAASMMTELANRVADVSHKSATTGADVARQTGVRMSLLASGFLAGIADALGEQGETEGKDE